MADDQNAPATKADIALILAELRASESRQTTNLDNFKVEVNNRFLEVNSRFEALQTDLENFKVEVNTRFHEFEHRVGELFSDMEARVVATVYRLGESGMQRLTSAERDAAVLKERIATLEERLVRIEKRLDLPPAQASS